VMAQRYLPGVARGDKRVLLLGGRVLGAVLRVPPEGELRANLHVGGRPEGTRLTPREREICDVVGSRCAGLGLELVGVDLIEGHLTEVNVTSPTGIRHIDAIEGTRLGTDVIAHLERRVAVLRGELVAAA
jgi:glutathione synthase